MAAGLLPTRVALLNEAIVLAEVTVQVLLLWIFVVACKRVKRDTRVLGRETALFAPRDQVFAVEATIISHVVTFIAETCSSKFVSVLIATLLAAFTDATVHIEIIAHAPGALVS